MSIVNISSTIDLFFIQAIKTRVFYKFKKCKKVWKSKIWQNIVNVEVELNVFARENVTNSTFVICSLSNKTCFVINTLHKCT